MDIARTALLAFLKDADLQYFSKVFELRDVVTEWLSYIPNTFPHYTRHTSGHSEQIIVQLSNLLFTDGDFKRPSVALSAVEGYVLCVAAYLHDAGMVCADDEKSQILQSAEWLDWVSPDGAGFRRWSEISEIRTRTSLLTSENSQFLVDVQVRFLIAEFVRARHHLRGGEIVAQNQTQLARFAFDDPILTRTIADVCVAHGLDRKELEDTDRFPEQRDIRGEKANVRFLAILFRLGDLLDMSSDRACPLLLNAACPLPADSLAHWTQYQRLTHRNTSPHRIEITAECQTQAEHRVLQDWCQWIVDEVASAAVSMPHAKRHARWTAPQTTLNEDNSSIVIRPALHATYLPSRWHFELDPQSVVERLVYDAYEDPLVFIRELIQNSLDATRCRIYQDLHAANAPLPAWPGDVDSAMRDQYPVRIEFNERTSLNELSGESQTKQIIVVEDNGIGMNAEIVQRYLLQVGRSYYSSNEFKRQYPFDPSSRFGIGFLSTFAASDEITIDTYKAGLGSTAIRLTLTGARNYLLTEHSTRSSPGTRIEVVMRDSVDLRSVKERIQSWCKRVEFPILIKEGSNEIQVTAEDPSIFLSEGANVSNPAETFAVRYFPIATRTLRGEIYIFVSRESSEERWDRLSYARYRYPDTHPMAVAPALPGNLVCQHGIAVGWERGIPHTDGWTARVDVRNGDVKASLTRANFNRASAFAVAGEIAGELLRVVRTHVESIDFDRPQRWRYLQRLMEQFSLPEYWRSLPGTVPVWNGDRDALASIDSVETHDIVIIDGIDSHSDSANPEKRQAHEQQLVNGASQVVVSGSVEQLLSQLARARIFADRFPCRVKVVEDGMAIYWARGVRDEHILGFVGYGRSRPLYMVPFEGSLVLGFEAHRTSDTVYGALLVNTCHPFAHWLRLVGKEACIRGGDITAEQAQQVFRLLATPLVHGGYEANKLESYLQAWREPGRTRPELVPPSLSTVDWMRSGWVKR